MKYYQALTWFCSILWIVSCSSHKNGGDATADSLAVTSGVVGDEGLFSFAIDSGVDRNGLDDAIYEGFLNEFSEAHKNDSLEIESHEMTSNQFFTAQGCLSARILELKLTDKKEGMSLIHWYLIAERPQYFAVYDPLVEDITERQGTADASLELGYSAGNECPVVGIRTSSEGGDIDFSKQEGITFYSVDGGFNEIARLQLENTIKEGYYNNPDSARVTSTKRTFKFVNSDKFPFDIEATVDDGTSTPAKELYTWQGTAYKLKP